VTDQDASGLEFARVVAGLIHLQASLLFNHEPMGSG
jgi:hypothetical protein